MKKGTKIKQVHVGPAPMDPDKEYINPKCEDQMEISGYKLNKRNYIITWILIIFSLGFLRLVFYWIPRFMLYFTHEQCSLAEAEKVLLRDQYKQWFVAKIHIITRDGTRVQVLPSAEASFSIHRDKLTTSIGLPSQASTQQLNDEHLIRYFQTKKVKYIWDKQVSHFVKLRGLDVGMGFSFFHEAKGLHSEEVIQKRVLYGNNHIAIHVTPIITLLFKEILSPFYVFQVFSVILWFCDAYELYASCILFISVLSIVTTIYQTRQIQRALRNTIHATEVVRVCRDDEFIEIPSEDLVPGDVIEVPRSGCMMQCDAVLVSGNCIVNESMLTGESVPVLKTPLPNPIRRAKDSPEEFFKIDDHSRHVLFCGTNVIQTRYYEKQRVRAVVIRTGFTTAKGDLTRSILYPKPVDFKFSHDTYMFITVLSVFALMGFTYTVILMVKAGRPVGHILRRALDLITIAVPPALPAALTVGTFFAQRRLKKALVYCISPSSINICGTLNIVCFDKTGTLTEDGLNMKYVVPATNGRFESENQPHEPLPIGQLLYGMATCHSLTIIDHKLTGDPLDQIMFETTGWDLKEPGEEESRFDMIAPTIVSPKSSTLNGTNVISAEITGQEIGIIRQFPFSSRLQRMSVITRRLVAKNFELYTKGSPEMVASLCKQDTVPYNFQEILIKFTKHGYRVLGFAYKPLKLNYMRVQRVTREQVEKDLNFVGLVVMENRIKPETKPTIDQLHNADIKTVMITGDNMLTALSVARECHMVDSNDQVILVQAYQSPENNNMPTLEFVYADEKDRKVEEITTGTGSNASIRIDEDNQRIHFAVTGRSWTVIREHFPDLLSKLVVRGKVYARMSPEQKAQLIEVLQSLGYYVGMCGDGANDCGALKMAHTGISLSEAEASVASAFTSKVSTIECVPTVIKQGRASLVTTFGIFKYMASYSLIQSTSALVLYWISANLTDFEFLYTDLFLILTLGITFGRTDAYPEITKDVPDVSLISVTPILSLVIQIAIQAGVQIFCFLNVYKQVWFEPYVINDEEDYACYENMAIFLSSSYQYIIMAVVFSKGAPFRKSMFSNYLFLINVAVCVAVTLLVTIYPPQEVAEFLELKPFPSSSYRLLYVGIASMNFLLSLFVEKFIIDNMYIRHKCERFLENLMPSSRCEYVAIEQEIAEQPDWPPISESKASLAEVFRKLDPLPPTQKSGEQSFSCESDDDPSDSCKSTPHINRDTQQNEQAEPTSVQKINLSAMQNDNYQSTTPLPSQSSVACSSSCSSSPVTGEYLSAAYEPTTVVTTVAVNDLCPNPATQGDVDLSSVEVNITSSTKQDGEEIAKSKKVESTQL